MCIHTHTHTHKHTHIFYTQKLTSSQLNKDLRACNVQDTVLDTLKGI